MVLHLSEQLDVPLRDRNQMLLAAGFAPAYAEQAIDAPDMAPVREALDRILKGHEPYPAVVVDRWWDLAAANASVALFTEHGRPAPARAAGQRAAHHAAPRRDGAAHPQPARVARPPARPPAPRSRRHRRRPARRAARRGRRLSRAARRRCARTSPASRCRCGSTSSGDRARVLQHDRRRSARPSTSRSPSWRSRRSSRPTSRPATTCAARRAVELRAGGLGERLEAHRVTLPALLAQHARPAADLRRELEVRGPRPVDSGRLLATHMPPGPRSTVRAVIGEPLRRCSVHSISTATRGDFRRSLFLGRAAHATGARATRGRDRAGSPREGSTATAAPRSSTVRRAGPTCRPPRRARSPPRRRGRSPARASRPRRARTWLGRYAWPEHDRDREAGDREEPDRAEQHRRRRAADQRQRHEQRQERHLRADEHAARAPAVDQPAADQRPDGAGTPA